MELRCEICGELISDLEVNSGQAAEMYNPKNIDENGPVHAECGVARGWEIS